MAASSICSACVCTGSPKQTQNYTCGLPIPLSTAISLDMICSDYVPPSLTAAIHCNRQTLFGEEVEIGLLYELVVTTLSGLCRYRIGDVVKVVRFHNSCPVIEFQYRQGQLLNMRSEKTSETMIYEAITTVIRRKGEKIQLVDYTCAESILLDFFPSCREAIEDTGAKNHLEIHAGVGSGVKPFYVVFLELKGLRQDAAETESLAQEVS